MPRNVAARTLVVIISVLPFACGGGSPTPVTPASPSPVPTAAPVPSPTPFPGFGCSLGPGSPAAQCSRESPTLLNDLDASINQLVQQRPDIFNLGQERGPGGYKIRSQGQFYLGVMRNLEARGMCSFFNGDELQIKSTNAFEDDFDIVTGDGYIRRGASSYRGSCSPASFPIGGPNFKFPQGDCPLPPSTELACDRETTTLLPDVEAALDELVRQRPDIFDLNRHANGAPDNWYFIVQADQYIPELRRVLLQRGLCAVDDGGEELVVKRSNDYSESFDVFLAGGYIRRGEGAYLGTCWPSYF